MLASDDDGLPTQEALDYIKNWNILESDGCFETTEENTNKLIDYVQQLWTYKNYIKYDKDSGLLELHTGGWSGNEDIVRELEGTVLWLLYFRAHQTGGHYYFKIPVADDLSDWVVTLNDGLDNL